MTYHLPSLCHFFYVLTLLSSRSEGFSICNIYNMSLYYNVITHLCMECNEVRCYKGKLICMKCRKKLEQIEKLSLRAERDKVGRRYYLLCKDCGAPTNSYKNTCDLCFFVRLRKSKGESIFDNDIYEKTPLWSKEQCFKYIKGLEERGLDCDLEDLLIWIPHCAESLNLYLNIDGMLPNAWVDFLWKRIWIWYRKQK